MGSSLSDNFRKIFGKNSVEIKDRMGFFYEGGQCENPGGFSELF